MSLFFFWPHQLPTNIIKQYICSVIYTRLNLNLIDLAVHVTLLHCIILLLAMIVAKVEIDHVVGVGSLHTNGEGVERVEGEGD